MSVSLFSASFFSAAGVTIRLETQGRQPTVQMARVLLRKRGNPHPLIQSLKLSEDCATHEAYKTICILCYCSFRSGFKQTGLNWAYAVLLTVSILDYRGC